MTKHKKIDNCIRNLLKERMFASIYFVSGINALKNKIDMMSDKDICKAFSGLIDPKMIRNDVDYIYKTLNDFLKKEN